MPLPSPYKNGIITNKDFSVDDTKRDKIVHPDLVAEAEETGKTGVIAELGALGPGAVITEEGIARLFDRHPASVKRAVERGELPPPCRLFGKNAWTVGVLIRHIEDRLTRAANDAEQLSKKIARLSP